jgi:SHQ1 protein
VMASTRRMLVYPYWRNWEFCAHVWNHTLHLVRSGRHRLIQALLRIRNILEKSESHYLGNKLFVDPYLYWMQNDAKNDNHGTNSEFTSLWLAESLQTSLSSFDDNLKKDLGLDLSRYEAMLDEEYGIQETKDMSGENNEVENEEISASTSTSSTNDEVLSGEDGDSLGTADDMGAGNGILNDVNASTCKNDAMVSRTISSSLLDSEICQGMSMLQIIDRGSAGVPSPDGETHILPLDSLQNVTTATDANSNRDRRKPIIVEID